MSCAGSAPVRPPATQSVTPWCASCGGLSSREDKPPHEAHQGVTLCVAGGRTGADPAQLIRLQAGEFAKQAVRGLAVVAPNGSADRKLDGLLVLLAKRTGGENRISIEDRLERDRSMRADGREGVGDFANGFLDLGEELRGSASRGFDGGGRDAGHDDT